MFVELLRDLLGWGIYATHMVHSNMIRVPKSLWERQPELGGYWFFVILMGVDIMDEYKIMEIRVYIYIGFFEFYISALYQLQF
jgi:hypothetical protein